MIKKSQNFKGYGSIRKGIHGAIGVLAIGVMLSFDTSVSADEVAVVSDNTSNAVKIFADSLNNHTIESVANSVIETTDYIALSTETELAVLDEAEQTTPEMINKQVENIQSSHELLQDAETNSYVEVSSTPSLIESLAEVVLEKESSTTSGSENSIAGVKASIIEESDLLTNVSEPATNLEDRKAPELLSITTDKVDYLAGETIVVTAEVSDDSSLGDSTVWFYTSDGSRYLLASADNIVHLPDGNYQAVFNLDIPLNRPSDVYTLRRLSLSDEIGNKRDYTDFGYELVVPELSLNVVGTTIDRVGPELISVATDKSDYLAGETIVVTALVSEDSSLGDSTIWFYTSDGSRYLLASADNIVHLPDGNYQAVFNLDIPLNRPSDVYTLRRLSLSDEIGNRRDYTDFGYELVAPEVSLIVNGVQNGTIVIHFQTEDGLTITEDRIITGTVKVIDAISGFDTVTNMTYNTLEEAPLHVASLDGTDYYRSRSIGQESGILGAGLTEVTYVYTPWIVSEERIDEEYGSVQVNYRTKDGLTLKDSVITYPETLVSYRLKTTYADGTTILSDPIEISVEFNISNELSFDEIYFDGKTYYYWEIDGETYGTLTPGSNQVTFIYSDSEVKEHFTTSVVVKDQMSDEELFVIDMVDEDSENLDIVIKDAIESYAKRHGISLSQTFSYVNGSAGSINGFGDAYIYRGVVQYVTDNSDKSLFDEKGLFIQEGIISNVLIDEPILYDVKFKYQGQVISTKRFSDALPVNTAILQALNEIDANKYRYDNVMLPHGTYATKIIYSDNGAYLAHYCEIIINLVDAPQSILGSELPLKVTPSANTTNTTEGEYTESFSTQQVTTNIIVKEESSEKQLFRMNFSGDESEELRQAIKKAVASYAEEHQLTLSQTNSYESERSTTSVTFGDITKSITVRTVIQYVVNISENSILENSDVFIPDGVLYDNLNEEYALFTIEFISNGETILTDSLVTTSTIDNLIRHKIVNIDSNRYHYKDVSVMGGFTSIISNTESYNGKFYKVTVELKGNDSNSLPVESSEELHESPNTNDSNQNSSEEVPEQNDNSKDDGSYDDDHNLAPMAGSNAQEQTNSEAIQKPASEEKNESHSGEGLPVPAEEIIPQQGRNEEDTEPSPAISASLDEQIHTEDGGVVAPSENSKTSDNQSDEWVDSSQQLPSQTSMSRNDLEKNSPTVIEQLKDNANILQTTFVESKSDGQVNSLSARNRYDIYQSQVAILESEDKITNANISTETDVQTANSSLLKNSDKSQSSTKESSEFKDDTQEKQSVGAITEKKTSKQKHYLIVAISVLSLVAALVSVGYQKHRKDE